MNRLRQFVGALAVLALCAAALPAQVNFPRREQPAHGKTRGLSQATTCVTTVTVIVPNAGAPSTSVASSCKSGPSLPSNAVAVTGIQTLNGWIATHDPSTGSSSSGVMTMAASPSLSGHARQFDTAYANYGGELYYVLFGTDATAKNFVYDAWAYLADSAGSIANLEMDMNQVMANGQTVIFGVQCDGWSGTWDYTENAGTPTAYIDRWVNSSAPCNVRDWAKNAWHHVQISYARDDAGTVTYQSVWLDGNEQQINATVPSAFALGWAPALITNFQMDSNDAGTAASTVYLDNLTVSRW